MEKHAGTTLPMALVCEVGGQRMTVLVDTGATYCVISPALVPALSTSTPTGQVVEFTHGHDEHRGEIWEIPVTLLADRGTNLTLRAKFCVAEEWTRPVAVLGVRFCLELLNVAFEPAIRAGQSGRCHFGPAHPTPP